MNPGLVEAVAIAIDHLLNLDIGIINLFQFEPAVALRGEIGLNKLADLILVHLIRTINNHIAQVHLFGGALLLFGHLIGYVGIAAALNILGQHRDVIVILKLILIYRRSVMGLGADTVVGRAIQEVFHLVIAPVGGHLTAILTTLKGLPLAYNRDLQEDKEPLFDAADTIELSLRALAGMLPGIEFDHERMAAAAADEMVAATDVADLLVRRGLPFREAHGVVGGLVRHAIDAGIPLSAIPREELAGFSDLLDDEYYEVLGEGSWLDSKVSRGGTSAAALADQIDLAAASLAALG